MGVKELVYFTSSKEVLDNLGIKYSINYSPVRASSKYNYFIAVRETDFNILLNYVEKQDDEIWIDFLLKKKHIIPFPDSKCFSNIELNNSGRRRLNRAERRKLNKKK